MSTVEQRTSPSTERHNDNMLFEGNPDSPESSVHVLRFVNVAFATAQTAIEREKDTEDISYRSNHEQDEDDK